MQLLRLLPRTYEILPPPALDLVLLAITEAGTDATLRSAHGERFNELRDDNRKIQGQINHIFHAAKEMGYHPDEAALAILRRKLEANNAAQLAAQSARGRSNPNGWGKLAAALVKEANLAAQKAMAAARQTKREVPTGPNSVFIEVDPVPPLDPLPMVPVDAKLKKGETHESCVTEKRGVLAKIDAEAADVNAKSAPPQEAVLRKAMRPLIVLRDTPSHEIRFGRNHEATVPFPMFRVDAESAGGTIPVAPDFRPAYVREHFEAIEREVREAIKKHYAAKGLVVLTPAEKAEKLAALAARKLASERIECAHLWASHAEGTHIEFRIDTDWRAVLGVEVPEAGEVFGGY